jgi:hypothetical protein
LIDTSGTGRQTGTNEAALDFVRFCHRRRRAGWPELYDEMCAVARRGLYHGWGFAELAEHGIAFGLAEMPGLAALVAEVNRQDPPRARRTAVGVMATIQAPYSAPAQGLGAAPAPVSTLVAEAVPAPTPLSASVTAMPASVAALPAPCCEPERDEVPSWEPRIGVAAAS